MDILRAADLPLHYNAVSVLENNLAQRAAQPALLSAERELSFGQVAAEVNQLGHALQRLGVRFGEAVATLSLDCAEWAVAYFATMKIGAVAVGMNTLLKPHEHAYVLQDCRARVLIVHQALAGTIAPIRGQLSGLEHVIVIGGPSPAVAGTLDYAALVAAESTELEAYPTHREDFCCLNYSSGSTGEPKGIFHAHKDLPLTAQLWAVNVLGLRESDRTFATAKLFFTFGTGGNLVFPWYVGASCVLMSEPPRVAANVLNTIKRFQPTIHYNAPTGYAALMANEAFNPADLRSVRLCVSAGESLPAAVWQSWKDRTGLDIIDGIGATEIWHIFISNRPGDIRPGSSGKPVPGFEVRIVDEHGLDVAPGYVGNLLVKGETTALFYLHQAAKSRRTFQGEWLLTGDKYTVDEDGYYWHAGRSDDMLKVGGIWVSPVEVEGTLVSHPAVLEAAVIGQPDASNLIKPKAFVVLKDGFAPEEALKLELTVYCREKMADYKRPREIEFVRELPKTATGKIQRYRLREA